MDVSNEYSNIPICRICLINLKSDETFLHVEDYGQTLTFETVQIRKMIEKTIPEMDLDICDSPIICITCYDLLLSSYMLRIKCNKTEEQVFEYMEANTLKIGDKIQLNHVKNMTQKFNNRKTNLEKIIEAEDYWPITDKELDKKGSKKKSTESYKSDIICIESESENSNYEPVSEEDKSNHSEEDHPSCNVQNNYGKRMFSCKKCEYKGYRVDLLKKHMSKCKGKKELDMFKCKLCPYSSCRKRNLKRHQLTHGGDRPYTCGICNKGFTEMNHIKSHMYKHSNAPLPFQCTEEGCSSSFTRKCDLKAHMIKHVKLCTYICKICKTSFLKEIQLTRHKKQHSKKIIKSKKLNLVKTVQENLVDKRGEL